MVEGDSLWDLPSFPSVECVRSDVDFGSKELIVCGVLEEEETAEGTGVGLPLIVEGSALKSEFIDLVGDASFRGKVGSSASVTIQSTTGKRQVLAVFGLGARNALMKGTCYKLGAYLASMAKERKSVSQACLVLPESYGEVNSRLTLEGVLMGSYKDTRWKSKKDTERICDTLTLVVDVPIDVASTVDFCEDITFTKQLVNAPANVLNASALADCMREVADCYKLDITVLERSDCEAKGMGLYLAVAQGATSEPKFIHVTYRPKEAVKRRVAFVGKAITFDSGGYNLKVGPDSMINLMKFDMGGAATIFGAARSIAKAQPKGVEVHFIAAACENLISGHAYRPGDVIRGSNGKTVEVINTDAEGRMTLADALVYADALKPDYIIDIATLTGSMLVALGHEYAGVMSPNDDIIGRILNAAKKTGEKAWRMPFVPEYRELLESSIADVKQLNTRVGDCLNAAVFLKEFVSNCKQWAHWDIAGTAWTEKKGGATGYGVKTLVQFVLDIDAM